MLIQQIMNKKLENVRMVTFKEDYVLNKKTGRTIPAEATRAMHVDVAERVRKKGGKVKIERFDYQSALSKAKARLAKQKAQRSTA